MENLIDLLINTDYAWAANHTIAEFLVGYVFGAALIIGAPSVFLFIAFMAALQRTKGAMVGYSDHKTYGDSSTYENTPSSQLDYSKALLKTSIQG
tara:strand:- start:7 stop:291 length:285 start_codon:yes stop_codon:yes gene_type:complete